jgi:hypothetical protein
MFEENTEQNAEIFKCLNERTDVQMDYIHAGEIHCCKGNINQTTS